MGKASSLTCEQLFKDVWDGSTPLKDAVLWPPDVFGLVAYTLGESGNYRRVLDNWPPKMGEYRKSRKTWDNWTRDVGEQWRDATLGKLNDVPRVVRDVWNRVLKDSKVQLCGVCNDGKEKARAAFCTDLLILLALADCSSVGLGLPTRNPDRAIRESVFLIQGDVTTLAMRLRSERVRVLPKLSTPQAGITLRSLSHHLALHTGNDVAPCWYHLLQAVPETFNILLAPWPVKTSRNQFKASKDNGHYGLLRYKPQENPKRVAGWTRKLLAKSDKAKREIHALVFPEDSLTEREFEAVQSVVDGRELVLIAGVAPATGKKSSNTVRFASGFGGSFQLYFTQAKHHRWKLDRKQIERYGIEKSLDPSKPWWEDIEIPPRQLHFVSLNEGTTMCCLICEDLARSDPVASLVRSVGPSLVVALLLDGPQVPVRWANKYAAALADDPGCSVLALTSLGMLNLSKTFGKEKRSWVVARWTDLNGSVEVDLAGRFEAAILSTQIVDSQEWTVDERSDKETTSRPILKEMILIPTDGSAPRRVPRT